MDTLYARIKKRREELGMSQAELASSLGYTDRSSIAKIEKGINDITQSKIAAFAGVLHTTPAYLMGWTDDYYDYDLDEDNRTEEIPIAIYESLMEMYGDDFQQVWYAWLRCESDCLSEGINSSVEDISPAVSSKRCIDCNKGNNRNIIRIAGRSGSYEERVLTDEQLTALKAILDQMPDVGDDI